MILNKNQWNARLYHQVWSFKLLLHLITQQLTEPDHLCCINTFLKIDAHYLSSVRCVKATFSEIMLANLTGFVQVLSFAELLECPKFAASPKTSRMAIKHSEICTKKVFTSSTVPPCDTYSYHHLPDLQFMPLPGSVVLSANMGKRKVQTHNCTLTINNSWVKPCDFLINASMLHSLQSLQALQKSVFLDCFPEMELASCAGWTMKWGCSLK